MWEDGKTASRYVSRGVRSLFGHHTDPSQWSFDDEWEGSREIALLDDHEVYGGGSAEFGAAIPLSQESPGDPGSPLPGIEGFRMPSGALAELFQAIRFETDQYSVQGRENLQSLKQLADYLAQHRNVYVFVEGHADERGSAAYNLSLGSKRANSVRTFLVQNGVHPDQLFTISYGKERPAALGHDELAWQQNRRSQFKIYER